ncbi:MAG: precorrin-6A reductase [Thermacetogeniaceae bacterium]
MILVLAGTKDGKELAAGLAGAGFEVLVSTATPLGEELLKGIPGVAVCSGRLDEVSLEELIKGKGVLGVLDATHPFAVEVTRNAARAAKRCGVPYLRWERASASLPEDPLVHLVSSWERAAERLASFGAKSVFLAVGVKPLRFFLEHPELRGCRFTARVLPTPESVDACRRLGLGLDRIIAMKGPGTLDLNRALLEACGSDALVTKESGSEGGTEVKVNAAISLGIPVIVVKRPEPELTFPVARSFEDVLRWAEGIVQMEKGCSEE